MEPLVYGTIPLGSQQQQHPDPCGAPGANFSWFREQQQQPHTCGATGVHDYGRVLGFRVHSNKVGTLA